MTDAKILTKTRLRLAKVLGPDGRFHEHCLGRIGRLLPHAEFSAWKEAPKGKVTKSRAQWATPTHQKVTLRVVIGIDRIR